MTERKKSIKTIMVLIVFTILTVYLVYHMSIIKNALDFMINLLFPFILGCAIAFVVNIPMRGIENGLFKNPESKLYSKKRLISMIITYLLVVLVLGVVVFIVVPEVKNTLTTVYNMLPDAVESGKTWALKKTKDFPEITEKISEIEFDAGKVAEWAEKYGGSLLTNTFSFFSSLISAIVNVLVGIIFSFYILAQKEKLGKQLKMVTYAMFKEKFADELMEFSKLANKTFSIFFACQFREGLILGTMFAVAMAIIGLPYPLTIGVLIAFTALIPVFGAFIGLFIGILLILVVEPKMVLWFIILFFSLQFIENYFIYPKLVGGDIGLSAIWVLLAVLVGGDLMGVVGMFIFIPLVSVFYSYFRIIIKKKLELKNIDVDKKIVPDDEPQTATSEVKAESQPEQTRQNKKKRK